MDGMNGRTDDAKTISLQLRQGMKNDFVIERKVVGHFGSFLGNKPTSYVGKRLIKVMHTLTHISLASFLWFIG